VITDRDMCMAAFLQGKSLCDLRVSEAMATELRTCAPGDSLADAEAGMREGQVRRLPVVDASGQLLGVLSLADLARGRGAARSRITASELADVLVAVSEPRPVRPSDLPLAAPAHAE